MSSTDQQRSPRLRGKTISVGCFCCVPGCSNFRQKDKRAGVKLTYHRIPLHDKKRTKLWLNHIGRDAWVPNTSSRICSIHFEGGKKSDDPKKPGYIPTIFPSRQKSINRRTTLTSSKAVSSPPPPKSEPQVIPSLMDHNYVYTRIDEAVETLCQEKVEKLRLEIQQLQRENENLKMRLKLKKKLKKEKI